MGRTQVSHSARPQVHSAPVNAKVAPANAKLQQQQQTRRPASSSTPKSHTNAHVYRPTPVAEHPDDAFMTGAWMFDQSRVPQWMQSQLPTTTKSTAAAQASQKRATTATAPKQMQQPAKQTHAKSATQTKPAATTKAQSSSNKSMHKVVRPTPLYEHPDTAFLSGAWLFDTARTPLWMQREVPTTACALVLRSRRLATALPTSRANRPHSTKHYLNVNWAGFKTFGAVPYTVIPSGSVKARNAHPDDAFFTGAWMFDAKCAPSWLTQELAKGKAQLQLQQLQQVTVQKQKTNHMQFAGVKLTSGRKLGV